MRRQLTPEESRRLFDLRQAGYTYQQLQDEFTISSATVRKYLRANGVELGEKPSSRGSAIRHAERVSALRQELEESLLEDALRVRESLFEPTVVFSFGGKDGHYREHVLDQPTHADRANIMRAVHSAVSAARTLADQDGGVKVQTVNLIIETARAMGLSSDGD